MTETVKLMAMLVVGAGGGVWLFFDGMKKWRRKRIIEDIPTSKIRSMAMGLVELQGTAERYLAPISSPLSNTACVFYKYLIERYERRGKTSSWVRVAGDTSVHPFFLRDDTGRVLVSPAGAELCCNAPEFKFTSGAVFGDGDIPPNIVAYLEANNIGYRSLFGNHKLRFTEWLINENDGVYVLGSVVKNGDFASERKAVLNRTLAALKNNPAEMKKLDTNNDGMVSVDEWDAAVARAQEALLRQELADSGEAAEDVSLVVQKGDEESTFILSEKSEKELLGSLMWQALGETVGGALLGSVCIYYLMRSFAGF